MPNSNKPLARSLIAKAERAVSKLDFHQALALFRRALDLAPQEERAIGGMLIANFCLDKPEIAPRIAELFASLKAFDKKRAQSFILGLIETIEAEEGERLAAFDRFIGEQNGIEYADFLALVGSSRSFSEIFESVTLSTNVYITQKREWFDFVDRLIDNGYIEVAYRFIEGASPLWCADDRSAALIAKLKAKEAATAEAAE